MDEDRRIAEVIDHSSKVLLITDLASAVSVGVVGKEDQGLLEGNNHPWCVLKYLTQETQVAAGDEVVTAGLGGIFPPGIPVGKVVEVKGSMDGFFKEARLWLAANLNSVQEVLILERS